ncbi:MAG: thioredoxin domain-containing protein [Cyclobacteriaceae bacterium]|nr:thioredoxin domain-containing protein [Cyclobacteriaceae bacterium]
MNSGKNQNRLAQSLSPYLRQHAGNPVDWYPWGKEALQHAIEEDKPIIVSIGYSACHWCHVMEKESFENEEIAAIMNKSFICIKVDREERPDVDQIYMDAIQSMGISGGWPLNIFATPDQKPFYGGTYFPPSQWAQIVDNVAQAYRNHRDQIIESADGFAKAVSLPELERYSISDAPETLNLLSLCKNLSVKFDPQWGGLQKVPKFPMPSIWHFLLRAMPSIRDEEIENHLYHTLRSMADGGIYDQLGGGFCRYSVDGEWRVPHFEKMLYDNAQMLSLYADAYTYFGEKSFKRVVEHTLSFLRKEFLSPEHGFYSALDADTEGEEGKYYVWRKQEIEEILGQEADFFCEYYEIRPEGNWEEGKNILNRRQSSDFLAEKYDLKPEQLENKIDACHESLLPVRSARIRPGLDDKIIAGWNGLMIKGLCCAYDALGTTEILKMACKTGDFLFDNMWKDGVLHRNYKAGKSYYHGCLEDYAFVIEGFLSLYTAGFEEKWLKRSLLLAETALEHFFDEQDSLFYFTDARGEKLIARKKELFDNVIPASNSVMALNLYRLGFTLDQRNFIDLAEKMLEKVKPFISSDLQYMTNWANLALFMSYPTAEVAICGPNALAMRKEFVRNWMPNVILVGSTEASSIPLLKNRMPKDGSTKIYVCYNKSCKLPVSDVVSAIRQIETP